jgi:hypothetical protein
MKILLTAFVALTVSGTAFAGKIIVPKGPSSKGTLASNGPKDETSTDKLIQEMMEECEWEEDTTKLNPNYYVAPPTGSGKTNQTAAVSNVVFGPTGTGKTNLKVALFDAIYGPTGSGRTQTILVDVKIKENVVCDLLLRIDPKVGEEMQRLLKEFEIIFPKELLEKEFYFQSK